MPLSIECPSCTSRFRVGDHLAGKRVKCKHCGTGIHVPDAPNLEKAKVLPVRHDTGDAPTYIEPVIRFSKPSLPHGPLADAVIRAEAFVAAEAIPPETVYSPGVGTIVNDPLLALAPRPIVANRQTFVPEHFSVRREVRLSTAAPEGFSPMLLLVYVGLQIAGAIYLSTQPSAISSMIWTVVISEIITFFAVVGPATWLGVWGASKAMRFELAAPTYIKVCALAVLPGMLLALIKVLPENPVLVVLAVLAILPATFFLTKLIFALTFLETVVTFLLGCVGWTMGRVVQLLLIGAIILGANMKSSPGANPAISGPIAVNLPAPDPAAVEVVPPTAPTATPVDPVFTDLDRLGQQARAMARTNWTSDVSRERMSEQFAGLQNHLNLLHSLANDEYRKAKYDEVAGVLSELQGRIAQLPSESPDPIIFQPITAVSGTWLPGSTGTGTPVSFQRYRLQVPADALIDLASAENAPEGLNWDVQPNGKLNICSQPRKDPRQERPWVRTRSFMKTDVPGVFSLDMVNIPVDISYGLMNGLPVTRIASAVSNDGPARFARDRFVKYVIADGQSWLVITATADVNDARTLAALDGSAWSVHQARADEPHIDPFTPEAMVARLRDDRAQPIVRRMGNAAEPALLARVNDPDPILRVRVIELLGEVGTKKSVSPLLLLCSDSNTQYAQAARAAVKKLSPSDMDDAAIGLMDAQSRDFTTRARGVAELAAAQPRADDPRRAKVAALLSEIVRDGQLGFAIPDESLGDALAVWQTPDTISGLLPMLDLKGDFMRRKTAMVVLARTKDKRAAWPIVRWLIEDTKNAESALISMGPIAEDDVLKVFDLKGVTPKARIAACHILAEIGTARSLKTLGFVVTDRKSAGDVDAGNAAIAQIRDRMNSGKPADAAPHAAGDDKTSKSGIWIPPTAK